MAFTEYIDHLIQHGKCCFILEQAKKDLSKPRKSILSSIEYLLGKGKLASPAKGFYVIVAPEYRKQGCLPAEQFIPYLMDYWKCPYYAGLLTAATYHGATHQSVHVFQVMIGSYRPPIKCGNVRIQFITKKHLKETPVQTIATSQSILTISAPESTAMDLVNYPQQSGGLSHVATVLTELQEVIEPEKIAQLIKIHPQLAWKQRLGYLLEFIGAQELSNIFKDYLSKQKRLDYIYLMPDELLKKGNKNRVWKIIENVPIESDL